MEIKKFKPIDHKIKTLIYGAAGCGKTSFAGTAKKAIFASAEGGLLSIAEKSPDFVEVKTLKDLSDLYSFLLHENHEFETVVIDSITEINEIIKLEIEKRLGRPMQLQDWGELSKKIRDLFRKFRDLPMNVILIAQEMYLTDEDKIKKIVPSMNGKAATEIAYFMDIVAYMHVESDGSRWLETASNKKLLTKDRSRMVGNNAPLDFSEWQELVQKIKTGEQKVSVKFSAKEENVKPEPPKSTSRPHLKNLQLELKARGATDATSALKILNATTGYYFESLDLPEDKASELLVILLQAPLKEEKKPESKIKGQEMASISVYSDPEKVKKMIAGLTTVVEVKGLFEEINNAFEEGDMTKSTQSILADLCLKKMQEINDGLLESEKPKRGRKSTK